MSFLNSILKAFVGDKSEKDVKALQPYINKESHFRFLLTNSTSPETNESLPPLAI